MPKFCVHCGKPLQEGEVCSCQSQAPQQQAPQQIPQQQIPQQQVPQQQVPQQQAPQQQAPQQQAPQQQAPQQQAPQQQAPQQQFPQQQFPPQQFPQQQFPQQSPAYPVAAPVVAAPKTPSDAEIYLKQLWQLITKIFRAPSSMLKSFAASADSNIAIGLIAIHALSFALFMFVLCIRIAAAINGTAAKFLSGFSSREYQGIGFPLAKDFFLSLFLSLVVAFLFPAILLFFNKTVFKANTTYRHMLCVSGSSSIAAVPFILAGLLIMFLNLNIGICVAALGIILEFLYAISALKGASQMDEDKAIYALFLSAAVLMIAIYILIRIFFPMYLPDSLADGIKGIGSGLSSFSGFLSN